MRFGLTAAEFEMLDKMAIQPVKSIGGRVWIFGSRARGDQKKFSDIDVLYQFSAAPVTPGLMAMVAEQLEESNFPFKVDLVQWESVAESYRDGILKDRIEI